MHKFIEHLRSRLVSSTAVGLVAVLVLGGTVAAITSPDFTYTTTKTGYLSIHPMALAPDRTNADYLILFEGELEDGNGACYSTGVNLPQGSRITQLAVWYSSPATSEGFAFLQRDALADGTTTSVTTSGDLSDDSGTRKLAILPLAGGATLVSNIGFVYGFGICPGENGTFLGARIAYTYTSAGD